MDLDCAALTEKMSDARAELVKYSEMQNTKANEDAWGVFLLGVPFSKLSGDVEGDVARLKGEVEAIDTARIKKRCGTNDGKNYASAAGASKAAEPSQAQGSPRHGSLGQGIGPTPDISTRTQVAASAPARVAGDTPGPTVAGLLPAGTTWIYRFSDRIYTGNSANVTVKVLHADDQIVEEQMTARVGATRAAAVRREIDARSTSFDRYRLGASEQALTEFAPYLFAAGGEKAVRGVNDAVGYPTGGGGAWIIRAAAPVWDEVTVPAGTFRAMRLEIDGKRMAQGWFITKFTFRVWYAPQVGRYVKYEHQTRRWDERTITDEAVELVGFNPPS